MWDHFFKVVSYRYLLYNSEASTSSASGNQNARHLQEKRILSSVAIRVRLIFLFPKGDGFMIDVWFYQWSFGQWVLVWCDRRLNLESAKNFANFGLGKIGNSRIHFGATWYKYWFSWSDTNHLPHFSSQRLQRSWKVLPKLRKWSHFLSKKKKKACFVSYQVSDLIRICMEMNVNLRLSRSLPFSRVT